MPTQAQLQQANALRKANTNLSIKDSVSQVLNPTPAPAIAGQPVQPTGGATLPIAPQVTPTTPAPVAPPPAPMAQAPVNPETGLSAPQVSTPTPVGATNQEIINAGGRVTNGVQEMPAKTPTPVKTETPIDYNTSVGREGEIQKNISDITAGNPTLLKDRNAFNQSFGYDTADQGKKALLDSAFQSGQPQMATSDQMFASIYTKLPVSDEQKNTLPYKIAQNRYLKANSYATMTPSQVSGAMNNGKLIEGSQTYEDLKTLNPKIIQDAENLRIVNGQSTNIWTYSNNPDGTPVKQNNLENQFASDYLDDYGTFLKSIYTPQTQEEVTNAIYTQDVKDAQEKATGYEVELNAIEKDMDAIEKDVEKELSGSGATGSRVRLEKIARKEALQSEYNSVLKSYTTYANKANNLITQNTSAYEKAYNQKQELVKAQASAAGLKYKNELALSQNQEEFEQKVAQQAETMKTPELAIPSVIEQYAGLGIMAQKSAQQHIADAKAFIAGGGTLGEYISQMQKDFQAKPEFVRSQQVKLGQLTDTEKLLLQSQLSEKSDVRNFNQQKEIAKMNNDYNRQDFLFQLENDPAKKLAMAELETKLNANKSLFDVLGKNVGTYEGNRGYDLAGKLGDPMPAGGNWKVESVIDANYSSSPYGN